MAVLTHQGYENISKSLVNKECMQIVANNIATYYISTLCKNTNLLTDDYKSKIYEKINNVFGKVNFYIIPTNVVEFNFNQYLSKIDNLTHTQKINSISNVKAIVNILNNQTQIKMFNKNIVENLGFSFNEVYIKEGYTLKPGEKYNEFLTFVKSVITKNITPSTFASSWQNDIRQNSLVINSATQIPEYEIEHYYQNLKYSGGYCNQQSKNSIDIVINACGTTSVASLVHELLHAMSYNEYGQSFESGFNVDSTRTKSGYRKYQLFNEVVNEYLTQRVMQQFCDSDLKSFNILKQNNNIYKDMIYLIKNFLEKYEKELVECLISPNPIKFKKLIGEQTFDKIAEGVDNIQALLDYRFYDNTSVLQYMEKKLQQEQSPLLVDNKLSIKIIVENLDMFKSKFLTDTKVKAIIDEIKNLQEVCKNTKMQQQNKQNYIK